MWYLKFRERMWKWMMRHRGARRIHMGRIFSPLVLTPHVYDFMTGFHFSIMQKRKSSLKGNVDSLKAKNVEQVLTEIKTKKYNPDDDVGSAKMKDFEHIPEEDSSSDEESDLSEEEEDTTDEEEEEEDDDKEELSRRDVSYGYHSVRGKMDHGMEDYLVAKKQNVDGKELGLYAIFDGHSGRDVAEYLQRYLFDNILKEPDFWMNPEKAVKRAYRTTDEEILEKVVGSRGGSTAVTAILINREKLVMANVGDSRGVLCKRRDIEQITVDHEPEKEKKLVESRGGFVSKNPGNVPRVDGQLAMTRAFGDGKLKEHITSEPDVRVETISADAKSIILASDGLWKVMSNDEASECIEEVDDAQEAAEELVKEALYKGSADDISCVVIMFN